MTYIGVGSSGWFEWTRQSGRRGSEVCGDWFEEQCGQISFGRTWFQTVTVSCYKMLKFYPPNQDIWTALLWRPLRWSSTINKMNTEDGLILGKSWKPIVRLLKDNINSTSSSLNPTYIHTPVPAL